MILLWRITTRCNFACGFCAYDRREAIARQSADPAEVERFTLLAADAALARGERLLVSWLGGEPLLWRPLLDLSQRLAWHPAIALSMTSNGTRLDDANVRKRLLESFAELTLSIDGPEAIHDRLRGADGSFARVQTSIIALAAARRASGSTLKLRANVVLMRETLGTFAALCHSLTDWGIDEITFNQLGGRDRPEFFPAQRLSRQDAQCLAAITDPLKVELGARGVQLCASPDYLARIDASTRDEAMAVANCRPGEDFLFVDEQGQVGPCSFTLDQYGIDIGQLRTPGDVAGLARRFQSARRQSRAAVCDDCPSTQIFGKFAA